MSSDYLRSNLLTKTEKINEAYLHLTNRCSGGCSHCYAGAKKESAEKELGTETWFGVLEQLKSLGAEGVVFLGGDPFIREDWLELVHYAAGKVGLKVRLFYNGWISEGKAEELARLNKDDRLYLLTSLEGPDAAGNDFIRGRGNYEKTVAGINNLLEVGIVPIINTVITSRNLKQLPLMAIRLKEMGIKRQHLLFPVNRGYLRERKELLFNPEELSEQLFKLHHTATEIGLFVDNFAAWKVRLSGNYDLCNAGYDLLAIGPEGNVYACPVTVNDDNFAAGNIRDRDLESIWHDAPTLRRIRDYSCSKNKKCTQCKVQSSCGGDCMMFGYYQEEAETGQGSLNSYNPYCSALNEVFSYLQQLDGAINKSEQNHLQAFQCC